MDNVAVAGRGSGANTDLTPTHLLALAPHAPTRPD